MNAAAAEFPAERAANRAALLARVDAVADVVIAHRDASETARRLAPACIEAIHEAGLTRMKSPREVGGAEAHPVDQMDVIEAMTMHDPAAAWSMFITSAVTGGTLSRLGQTAVDEILKDGKFPMMAGSLKPDGNAVRVDGGYRVSGRWSWGSGVLHADYVAVPVLVGGERSIVQAVVPRARITIDDNWHTLGMRGTGSCDYVLDDVFVPDTFINEGAKPNERGGALFRLGSPGYVVNEHGSFAYALGRLALATATDMAVEKKRGYGSRQSIADREVFQRAIGEGALRMLASRTLMVDVLDRLMAAAESDGVPPAAIQAEARAAAVLCTDDALDVVGKLFRYAGGSAVMNNSLFQRCLRDLYTVQSHLVVSDSAYEIYGQLLLGLSDSAPLR